MTFLFEQQRNSHEEYLVNKKHFQPKGRGMIIVHHLGQSSQDLGNISKGQPAWGNSPPESLGALDRNSSDKSGTAKHLLVTWQHNNGDNSLHSESMDIVEKILCTIKDPLG